jgi:tetratricopeptide (TPR) repeat protein
MKGEYNEALKELDIRLISKNTTNEEKLSLLYLKSKSLNSLGNYEEAIKTTENLRILARAHNDSLREIDAFLEESYSFYRLNRIDESLNQLNIAEELIGNSIGLEGIKERRANLLVNQVYNYTAKGDVNQADLLSQQNYYLCSEIDDPSHLARAYYIMGWVSSNKGDMDAAINSYKKSLQFREDIGNQFSIAHTLFSLGYVYRCKGDLETAHKYLTRSLQIREKVGNKEDLSWTILNLGDIYYGKGDYDKAQNYYEKSLHMNSEIEFKHGIIYSLMRLSMVFEYNQNFQLVLNSLEKALEIAKEEKIIESEVYILFDIVEFVSKKEIHYSEIDDVLKRLNEISLQHKHPIFNLAYRLADALIQKASNKTQEKKNALNILREITSEDIIFYNFTRIAMTNYSELLAEELQKYFGKGEIISELTDLSELLSLEPSFQHSYLMIAETWLNQTQTALERIDIDKARELLNYAQYLCDFLNLYNKGPTPFKIVYLLFTKERSLNELSELLNLTKGALNNHLKLLMSLKLVKVSREEQVRSATMLKKYYSLDSQGKELLQPLNVNILESTNQQYDLSKPLINSLMIPRLMTKITKDSLEYLDMYQSYLEDQYLLKPEEASSEARSKSINNDIVKSIFRKNNEINIQHFFLSDEQYKNYMKLWREFEEKLTEEVFNQEKEKQEKSTYVTHLSLPLKEMIMLESSIKDIEKKK